MPINPSIKYHWIDEVERLEEYEPGGYHPVAIDDLLHSRYRVIDKLGYGGYSTIWLARDEKVNRFVAVKIGISSVPRQREIEVLQALHDSLPSPEATHLAANDDACTAIPKVLDTFDVCGPNGTHTCYTLAPAHGSLGEAAWCRLFPIQVVRALAAKLATVVAFVHSRGFVHGDIRLRNVLVHHPSTFDELSVPEFREAYGEPYTEPITRVDDEPLTDNVPMEAVVPKFLGKKAQDFTLADVNGLTLCDFGEAFSPATEQRLGKDCGIPLPSKAPEALFEPDAPVSFPSDIWSLGTAIWEILGMKFLFTDFGGPDEVVAEQIEALGPQTFPESWRTQWERKGEGEDDISNRTADVEIPRQPTRKRTPWPCLENAFEEFVQKYRRKREATGIFEEDETQAILELMRGMLKFRPEERLTIDEVLQSRWMTKWALQTALVKPEPQESITSVAIREP